MSTTTDPSTKSVSIPLASLPPGSRQLVTIGRREIAVFNVDGTIHAVANGCPHQRAPMVAGTICGTRVESEVGAYKYEAGYQVLRCPWHAYEFDLETGRCLADPERLKIGVYRVEILDEEVAIHV